MCIHVPPPPPHSANCNTTHLSPPCTTYNHCHHTLQVAIIICTMYTNCVGHQQIATATTKIKASPLQVAEGDYHRLCKRYCSLLEGGNTTSASRGPGTISASWSAWDAATTQLAQGKLKPCRADVQVAYMLHNAESHSHFHRCWSPVPMTCSELY